MSKRYTLRINMLLAAALLTFAVNAAQQQYDSGDPTAAEQHVLELINRARANPAAEGTRLGVDINEGLPAGQTAVVRPPLAMNKILLGTARAHSLDMYSRKYFAHTDPDGNDPFKRINGAGYDGNAEGENIAAGSLNSADSLEDLLMTDANYPGRGHRQNLLNTDPSFFFREIGVGYESGLLPIVGSSQPGVNGLKDFITQDFGSNATGPFIVGVVYNDANNNNFYDVGEGLSGVTITPDSGDFFAITGSAGGYAFPVGTSGTVSLTASGGGLAAPITVQVTLGKSNIKVDFKAGAASSITAPMITSPLTASGAVAVNFNYSIMASGTQPISFGAAGLPKGLTLSGSTISGTPMQAGQFMVTLTAMNSKSTDTETLMLDIAPAAMSQSNSTIDTDGDGFPDELEAALGTSPTDKNDTPFGGKPASPIPLAIARLQIKLNFARDNNDTVTLTGSLPVSAGFIAAGQPVTMDIGGVVQKFVLNDRGIAGTPGVSSFSVRIKKLRGAVTGEPAAPFSIKLWKGHFAGLLVDEGLVDATVDTAVTIPVILLFNQQYLNAAPELKYSGHAAKLGNTK